MNGFIISSLLFLSSSCQEVAIKSWRLGAQTLQDNGPVVLHVLEERVDDLSVKPNVTGYPPSRSRSAAKVPGAVCSSRSSVPLGVAPQPAEFVIKSWTLELSVCMNVARNVLWDYEIPNFHIKQKINHFFPSQYPSQYPQSRSKTCRASEIKFNNVTLLIGMA